MVLGYTWLRSLNPQIDWVAGLIRLPSHAVTFAARSSVTSMRKKPACDFLLSGQDYDQLMRNPRVRRTLKVWQVTGVLSQEQPARLNLVRQAHGYRLRDPNVYREFDNVLRPRGISVDACCEAVMASLKAGRVLAAIDCPACSFAHLDNYALAIQEHRVHTCQKCSHTWE